MSLKVLNKLSQAASLMGSIGGKHGKGKVKRRSKAHYKRMVEARKKKVAKFYDNGR